MSILQTAFQLLIDLAAIITVIIGGYKVIRRIKPAGIIDIRIRLGRATIGVV